MNLRDTGLLYLMKLEYGFSYSTDDIRITFQDNTALQQEKEWLASRLWEKYDFNTTAIPSIFYLFHKSTLFYRDSGKKKEKKLELATVSLRRAEWNCSGNQN